jgi:F0F1-type ATP synthase assembly protein I
MEINQEPSPEQQQQDQSQERRRHSNSFLRYTSMASQMAITIFLGVWGGIQLDKYFPQGIPIFTLVLSLLGVVLAVYLVIKDFIRKK